jgi:hypothetical protein
MRVPIAASTLAVAALLAASPAAAQQQQPFCLKSGPAPANCMFASMAQCEQAKTRASDQCIMAQPGTTGAGGGTQQPGTMQRPAPGETPDANRPR